MSYIAKTERERIMKGEKSKLLRKLAILGVLFALGATAFSFETPLILPLTGVALVSVSVLFSIFALIDYDVASMHYGPQKGATR